MTTASIGYQSIVSYSTDGSSYSALGQVVDIKGMSAKVKSIDVTNNSSANAACEYIAGMIEPQPITLSIIYDNSILGTLTGMLRTTYFWQIQYSDTHTWTCKGFITSLENNNPLDDKHVIDLEIQLTGLPSFS